MEQPAGPELRQASDRNVARIYFSVRDARKTAIDAEKRLRDFDSMSDEEKKGHPHPIKLTGSRSPLSLEALTPIKNLWITAWLIEG